MSAPETPSGPALAEPIVHLCDVCIHIDECSGAAEFPVWDCEFFDDGYEGPEYYDGDAWREWQAATLGFGIGIERRQHEDSGGIR